MSAALSNDAATQLKALYAEMQPRSLYPLWEVLARWSRRRRVPRPRCIAGGMPRRATTCCGPAT